MVYWCIIATSICVCKILFKKLQGCKYFTITLSYQKVGTNYLNIAMHCHLFLFMTTPGSLLLFTSLIIFAPSPSYALRCYTDLASTKVRSFIHKFLISLKHICYNCFLLRARRWNVGWIQAGTLPTKEAGMATLKITWLRWFQQGLNVIGGIGLELKYGRSIKEEI